MPHLYALSLQKATAITHAVYGNFSAPKAQELVVSRGKTLELLRPDETGKVQSIYSEEIFGVVRSLAPFRLTGANRDYIVLGMFITFRYKKCFIAIFSFMFGFGNKKFLVEY